MKKKFWLVRPMAVAVSGCFSVAPAFANPTAPQVMHGNVQMQGLGTNNLKITNSPGSIIHWQGFSIGAGQVTQFQQQSASSAVLNRVVGADISQIHGQLLSNGRVFLINPAGILIGAGAVIDTAGFVGSTLRMQDGDFLAGKLKFQGDAGAGSIINHGWIKAGQGGNIVLVAPDIQNSGIIQTEGGQIVLAAGRKMTIGSLDLEGVSFEIQAPTDSVLNVGKLLADGGAVGVFAGTLKHTGDIRANALARDASGRIVLKGQGDVTLAAGSTTKADGAGGGDVLVQSASGHTRIAGAVTATGSAGRGGDIRVLGERVSLVENARLDASGTVGGGQIRFGGDYQGLNAALPNASRAFVGENAKLRADATDTGDGGRIIVWADKTTQFYGNLSARGGAGSGNGGFAEVSGKDTLIFTGGADLFAPRGRQGTLLLDPLDLYVDMRGGSITSIIDEASDVPENAVTISPAALAAMSADVKLHARRYMKISDPINLTRDGQNLTAEVDVFPETSPAGTPSNSLYIAANITTNRGNVTLKAPLIQSGGGPALAITTGGGAITIDATGLVDTGSGVNVNGLLLDAGMGAVIVRSPEGFATLGDVIGGSFTGSAKHTFFAGGITTTGPVDVRSTEGFVGFNGPIVSGGGAVLLQSPMSQVFGNGIDSGGGSVTINALSSISPGEITTAGGAVNLTSVESSVQVFGNGISAGSGPVSLSGASIFTGAIDTTNTVTLLASEGFIFSTVDHASSLTATASNPDGSANITINQTDAATPLNATSILATAAGCNFFCNTASINIGATGTVNAGVIRATAPTSAFGTGATVSIISSAGSILPMSPASQITGIDVALGTGQRTSGSIGTPSAPLNVDVKRGFTLDANGTFDVVFNDPAGLIAQPGPIQLTANVGVATGSPYSGTLRSSGGNVLLSANADTALVTLTSLPTTGFDQAFEGSNPLLSFNVPNGGLNIPSLSVPEGSADPGVGLDVTISARDPLVVGTYTRQGTAGSQGRSTSISSSDSAVTIGTLSGNNDNVFISGPLGVAISASGVTTTGSVTVQSTTGDIAIGRIMSGGGVDVSSTTGTITV
ncbi:MAG TPA: filamentous hemagglutinin N-terminal domain-containing protein, partial [Burkholderiales bacterium]|nr:filamentous hemagglutinin N-terminal domain-containing protein [Burkholderiales bacterium]